MSHHSFLSTILCHSATKEPLAINQHNEMESNCASKSINNDILIEVKKHRRRSLNDLPKLINYCEIFKLSVPYCENETYF